MPTKIDKIKILPAKTRHSLEMKRLNEACLPENYPSYFWKEYILYNNSFVAIKDSIVYGYILCGSRGEICSFCVDEKYRGQGLGKLLLDTVINHFKNKGDNVTLSLQVRVNNSTAISLYKSRGFIIERVLPGYYGDGEDGYSMKK